MLQIGRKLYFDFEGSLLLDTGERKGNVRETTIDEDFQTFPQLQDLTQDNVQLVQLFYGEKVGEFTDIGFIKLANGKIVIYPRLTISVDKLQIKADAIDTAMITVTTQNDCIVTFKVNNGAFYNIQTINKIATFQFATDIVGTHTMEASNELYGANSVQVETI